MSTPFDGVILAVDPGLASGVALLRVTGDSFRSASVTRIYTGEEQPEELYPVMTTLYHEVVEPLGVEFKVVAESFIISQRTVGNSQAPWSLENIGIIKLFCDIHLPGGRKELTLQSPAEAKKLIDNAKLKRLGLWHRGGEGHANDALRHGVTYLIRRGWVDRRLLSPDTEESSE